MPPEGPEEPRLIRPSPEERRQMHEDTKREWLRQALEADRKALDDARRAGINVDEIARRHELTLDRPLEEQVRGQSLDDLDTTQGRYENAAREAMQERIRAGHFIEETDPDVRLIRKAAVLEKGAEADPAERTTESYKQTKEQLRQRMSDPGFHQKMLNGQVVIESNVHASEDPAGLKRNWEVEKLITEEERQRIIRMHEGTPRTVRPAAPPPPPRGAVPPEPPPGEGKGISGQTQEALRRAGCDKQVQVVPTEEGMKLRVTSAGGKLIGEVRYQPNDPTSLQKAAKLLARGTLANPEDFVKILRLAGMMFLIAGALRSIRHMADPERTLELMEKYARVYHAAARAAQMNDWTQVSGELADWSQSMAELTGVMGELGAKGLLAVLDRWLITFGAESISKGDAKLYMWMHTQIMEYIRRARAELRSAPAAEPPATPAPAAPPPATPPPQPEAAAPPPQAPAPARAPAEPTPPPVPEWRESGRQQEIALTKQSIRLIEQAIAHLKAVRPAGPTEKQMVDEYIRGWERDLTAQQAKLKALETPAVIGSRPPARSTRLIGLAAAVLVVAGGIVAWSYLKPGPLAGTESSPTALPAESPTTPVAPTPSPAPTPAPAPSPAPTPAPAGKGEVQYRWLAGPIHVGYHSGTVSCYTVPIHFQQTPTGGAKPLDVKDLLTFTWKAEIPCGKTAHPNSADPSELDWNHADCPHPGEAAGGTAKTVHAGTLTVVVRDKLSGTEVTRTYTAGSLAGDGKEAPFVYEGKAPGR